MPQRKLFQNLINDLAALEATEIQIRATGVYPRRGTKVADVAVYQNNGTPTIKASRFVERATGKHRGWSGLIFKAVAEWLFRHGNMNQVLTDAGIKVSFDISRVCDRIDTGRLKRSFQPFIKQTDARSLYSR